MNSFVDIERDERLAALTSAPRSGAGNDGRPLSGRAFPIALTCVFFIALLLSLTAGVATYRSIASSQARADAQRESLGLVVNAVRASDATGAIARGKGPEGDSLVIVESLDSGLYETRIYAYEGSILEEYSLTGSPYSPDKATTLAASSGFSFSYGDGLLRVTTDEGTAEVALRSMQGGGR